jgi:hypothetical protein
VEIKGKDRKNRKGNRGGSQKERRNRKEGIGKKEKIERKERRKLSEI